MTSIKKRRTNSHSRNDSGTGSSLPGSVGTIGTGRLGGISQHGINTTYNDMLRGNAGDNDFMQQLAGLGIEQNKGLTGSQRDDLNKQLLDQQLNYLVELEKRGYNEQLLQNQRTYDSPTNQLARLMGAGISRDAAIQMLSGAGSGGSSMPFSDGATEAAGIPASESRANEIEAKLGIANTVFGGISALSSMVQLGFSIPQSIAQASYMRSQAFMSDLQKNAYQSANETYNVLSTIGASADAFGSISAASAAISDAANNGNVAAKQFIASGRLSKMHENGAMVAPLMGKMYKDNRSAADYAEQFYNEQSVLAMQSEQLHATTRKLAQETVNLEKTYDEICANTDFIEAQTRRENATIDYLRKQGRIADAEAYEKELENRETEALYNAEFVGSDGQTHSGLWFLTANSMYNLALNELIGAAQTTPESRDYVCSKIAMDAKLSYYASALDAIQNELGYRFLLDNDATASLYAGLKKIGYYDYITAIGNSTYTATTSNKVDMGILGNAGSEQTQTFQFTPEKQFKVRTIKDDYKKKTAK